MGTWGKGGMEDVRGSRNRKAGVPTMVPESRNESDFFRLAGAQATGTGGPEVSQGISVACSSALCHRPGQRPA